MDSNTQPAPDITQTVRELIRSKRLDEASEICISAIKDEYVDKQMYIFFLLFLIREKELEMQQPQIFDISDDPDVLINHYRTLKFFIRRQEFPQMEPLRNELFSYCKATNTSAIALEIITEFSTLDTESVIQNILKGLNLYE